ncbi:MAG: succinate dehydrogenase/fumarate reductase iron-sulfur subunit [Acidobacteriota bacterium]|nr:succinate dehydrogenase/fumarate reductase iron-sulfur subunit [Acidobacteriota bacterium]
MKLHLRVWRQRRPDAAGAFADYDLDDVSPEMSFLEMLDVLNERLTLGGEEPIAFDHDCREGICGSCSLMINGTAHGPNRGTATCQLHMRTFADGDTLRIEPWRSAAFPVLRDLIVDRGAFDGIIQAGGFVSVNTGSAVEANLIPIGKPEADLAMDAAACIGCGACVAQCPNGAAQLFTAAKVSQLAILPQGRPERARRVLGMVRAMEESFGACSNFAQCEAVCPKSISIGFIARMNGEFLRAALAQPAAD